MTAPLPTAWTSPTAGMFNALVRLNIRRLNVYIAELRLLIGIEAERNHELRTTASYRETAIAGYIDRTGLEP